MQKKANHIPCTFGMQQVSPPPICSSAMESSSSSSNHQPRQQQQGPQLLHLLLREGPPWLEPFLNARYFDPCRHHIFSKNEKNHFCIDCYLTVQGPLCCRGLHSDHASHRTLQIRRASHADGIRVDDISKLLDISGIQTYIINNHRIVFLLRQLNKPNPNASASASASSASASASAPGPAASRHGTTNLPLAMNAAMNCGNAAMSRHCLACGRALSTDPMKFCSIKCKLVVIRQQAAGQVSGSMAAAGSYYSLMPSNSAMDPALLISSYNHQLAAAAGYGSSSAGVHWPSKNIPDPQYRYIALGSMQDTSSNIAALGCQYNAMKNATSIMSGTAAAAAAAAASTHPKRKFDLASLPGASDQNLSVAPDRAPPLNVSDHTMMMTMMMANAAAKTDSSLLSPISVLRPPSSAARSQYQEAKFCEKKLQAQAATDSGTNVSRGIVKVLAPELLYGSTTSHVPVVHGMVSDHERLEVALLHKMLGNYRKKRRKGMPHRAPLF